MKKKILLPLVMATCLTACGSKSESQNNKIQHYAIYCFARNEYGNTKIDLYTECGCKDFWKMEGDLANKNIISMECENIYYSNSSNEKHIHYVVIYTD